MNIRGGTRFTPVFEYANHHKVNLLVYFTDGKGEEKLLTIPKGYKTLWVISGRGDKLSLTEPYGAWELINGIPYNMTPAPSTQHQKIVTTLIALFYNALKDSPCQVFGAPFDVRLPEKEKNSSKDIFSVVQPDLVIICDRNKLDSRGCLGEPDLIIEITSPSTLRKDIKDKFHLYEKAGVNQYWIIYPEQPLTNEYQN